ncbi:hypothetical protein GCM10009838_79080 [Catenulispora subtropica]|uniref:Secreted protein n=1 Tax=Catenulispora subtropica TaxID=450798 RepID=A0ABN2T9G0_9ACTN
MVTAGAAVVFFVVFDVVVLLFLGMTDPLEIKWVSDTCMPRPGRRRALWSVAASTASSIDRHEVKWVIVSGSGAAPIEV